MAQPDAKDDEIAELRVLLHQASEIIAAIRSRESRKEKLWRKKLAEKNIT